MDQKPNIKYDLIRPSGKAKPETRAPAANELATAVTRVVWIIIRTYPTRICWPLTAVAGNRLQNKRADVYYFPFRYFRQAVWNGRVSVDPASDDRRQTRWAALTRLWCGGNFDSEEGGVPGDDDKSWFNTFPPNEIWYLGRYLIVFFFFFTH